MTNFNFLMPLKGTATKEFIFKDGNWELHKNYKSGKFFKGFEVPVEDLKEAYEVLEENQNHPVFMIHGAIIDGVDKERMIRRKRSGHQDGGKPTITDRNLQLVCFDIDDFDGSLDEFLGKMPGAFQKADYIYQYSSSHGLVSQGLKCHLFFWLSKPIHNTDLKSWAQTYNKVQGWGNVIDHSIYNAAQPIYTQRRICKGGVDPISDFIGYIEREGELHWAPGDIEDTPTPKVSNLKKTDYDLALGVEKILTSENYHDELNKLALSLINRKVPPGTVKQMLRGAMNSAPTKDARWQERYDDIGRSVNSAAEIVDSPSIEDVIAWIYDEDTNTVKADFAKKCMKLNPMDKTTAIVQISKKIGFGVSDVKKTIKLAEEEDQEERIEAAKAAKSAERETRGIYEIEVTAINTGEVSKRAGDILSKSLKEPRVFLMGGSLASVSLGVPKTIRQCSKLAEMGQDYPKIPIIHPFRKPFYSLSGRLEQDVVFQNEKGTDVECPTRVMHMIGEATNNNFKPLTGIVEHPFIDGNWKLIQEEGYNEETGLFTMLHHKLKIKKMDGKEAYQYLAYEMFDEFPFGSDLDRAVAVAALMTAIQRPTIAGDSGMPGFGIVSPIQSSGKTTLAQLISYAAFNRPVAASSWSSDEEELGKHILAILQEGHSCVLFDNIKQGATIQSGRLANAMSNDVFGGRQLGENKTIEVPSSVIWLFTGNGIRFVGDFATRVYPIVINPDMKDPNTRVFKRENIGQWAMDNRKKIISAVLSIIIEGKDMMPIGGSTRFQLWDKFVRRPLFKASGIDANCAIKNNQADDPLQLAKYQLLSCLQDEFGDKDFTTKDIITQAYGAFEAGDTDLGASLSDLLPGKSKNSMSIGRYLSTMVDVVLDDLSLKKKTSNVVYWNVINKG